MNVDGGLAERNPQTGALETSNAAVTALAVRALALFAAEGDSAAATTATNARAWLAARQTSNGSWNNDPFLTARAVAALPAATGAQIVDSDSDGLTDVVEVSLGTQSAVADAQDQVNNAGNSVPGVTTASFRAAGMVGEPFSYNLNATMGGTYSYALVNGSLPPGVSLAASGVLSGLPSAVGSYAFDYRATEAGGDPKLVIGRIDIAEAAAPAGNDSDVPMPAWALLALGGALLEVMRRRTAHSS